MATLPSSRSSSTTTNRWREKLNGVEFTLPRDKAPRPTTLPYNRSVSLTNHSQLSPQDNCDLNPLRKLRDKNFSLIRPRLKTLPIVQTDNISNDFNDHNCHSPNYLANSDYSFTSSHRNSVNDNKGPEDVNLQSSQELHCKNTENKQIHDSLNPIPLPPRDKSKITLTNYKRHVRKHPLIIPGTGLQRTLNKVTQDSPTDENSFGVQKSLVSNNNYNNHAIKQVDHQSSSKLKDFDVCCTNTNTDLIDGSYANQFIENNFPTKSAMYQNKLSLESINDLMHHHDNMDSASLHFESILENDIGHHDMVDGGGGSSRRNHCTMSNNNDHIGDHENGGGGARNINDDDEDDDCFEMQNDLINKNGGADESRNLDVIEKKKQEFSQKHPKYVQPKNELASNALFNKIKSSVELASTASFNGSLNGGLRTTSRMRDRSRSEDDDVDDDDDDDDEAFLNENCMSTANVVSCEDLLEFADDRPNGKERGADSDEVRIMSKVLGNVAVPEQCLSALDTINWDVHKAIKIYKLYNIINTSSLTMEECCDALKLYDWDLQATVAKLKETF